MTPVADESVTFTAGRPALRQLGELEVIVIPLLTDAGRFDHGVTVFLRYPAPPKAAGMLCRLRSPGSVELEFFTNRDGQFRTGELADGEYEMVVGTADDFPRSKR